MSVEHDAAEVQAGRALVERWRTGALPRRDPEIPARKGSGDTPLSPAQERLWFLEQLTPGTSAYAVSFCAWMRGPLDEHALAASVQALVSRHEILRARVRMVTSEPRLVIDEAPRIRLDTADLRNLPADRREDEALRRAEAALRQPFDLAAGPLARVKLVRVASDRYLLGVIAHHLVCDGWSLGVALRELAALYAAYATGQTPSLPDLPIQYRDVAAWQRQHADGPSWEPDLEYWAERLAELPALKLPTDQPRSAVAAPTLRGRRRRVRLPGELTASLRQLGRETHTTLYMVLLAAFQALFGRLSNQEDVAVGSPVANRRRPEVQGLIGPLVNMLTVRTDLAGNPTLRQLLGRVRESCLGAYAHQEVPFERVVERLQPNRSGNRHPLFQVAFALQGMLPLPASFGGVDLEPVELAPEAVQYDLELELWDTGSGLEGSLGYRTDLFGEATAAQLLDRLQRLLRQVCADPGRRLGDLDLLADTERRLLVAWNRTTASPAGERCVQELFEQQAARSPTAVAVELGDQRLTYDDLNARANQLARHLRGVGVEPGTTVAMCVERELEMVVGLLGILKAGGSYLPLDPGHPAERLGFMIADTRALVLVTKQRLLGRLAERDRRRLRVVCLDRDQGQIAALPRRNLDPPTTARHLAYVIYTSGSTGHPKGVEVEQRSLWSHCLAMRAALGLTPDERVLQFSGVAFDTAIEQILTPLTCGATVVLRGAALWSPAELWRNVPALGLTVVNLTPAYWQQAVAALPDGGGGTLAPLRLLIVGGDVVAPKVVAAWRRKVTGVRLLNAYGPTEATVTTTLFDATGATGAGPLPIGRPIANRQVHVLDRWLRPVPIGVPGELYIGGACLARGYLGRPGLTAERFIPDPFAIDPGIEPGQRLYRTGDLARYRPDGNLEFLGRVDRQVKLRGFRIEPGELEAALASHPAVREAVVVAREDQPGERRLVAYVVCTGEPPSPGELRAYLARTQPEYMLPAAYVVLDALPLNRSGKVDRKALPAPGTTRPALTGGYVAPRNPTEWLLAGIWAELLGLERVGVHDNFFELGGHSLLATRVVNHLSEALGAEVPLRLLFERPTVATLAAALPAPSPGQALAPMAPIPRLPRVLSPLEGVGVPVDVALSLDDVGTEVWDRLPQDSFFKSAAWLGRVEGTLSPRSAYIMARDERDAPVAGLAAYLVQPDAYLLLNPPRLAVWPELRAAVAPFQPERERHRTDALARALTSELADRYPAAVCVCPYSCTAGTVGAVRRPEVAEALLDAFAEVAADWGARSCAFLHLQEQEQPVLAAALRRRGHAAVTLAAQARLGVSWPSVDHYVASLGRHRRGRVRHELRALQAAGLTTEVVDGSRLRELIDDLAPLYANLQGKYGHTASLEAARETLAWIETRFADVTSVVLVRDRDHVLAFHVFYEVGGTFYTYLTGQTYERRARDGFAYFHATYYEPIRLAISRGVGEIDFGVESYQAKVARGCQLQPLTSLFDFGADLRDELAELFGLVNAAQHTRLGRAA